MQLFRVSVRYRPESADRVLLVVHADDEADARSLSAAYGEVLEVSPIRSRAVGMLMEHLPEKPLAWTAPDYERAVARTVRNGQTADVKVTTIDTSPAAYDPELLDLMLPSIEKLKSAP